MLNNLSIGNYIYKDSILNKLNPLSKIICLIIFLGLSLISNLKINIILFVFVLLLIKISKINIKIYLKNILSIKYFLLFIIIINLIFRVNYLITILSIIKLITIILYTSIFMYTTSITDIMKGLSSFFYPISKIGIKINKIILIITFSIKFIPLIIEQASVILKSLASRGLNFNKNLKDKIFSIKALLVPLFVNSIKKADHISEIMEVRGYDINIIKIKNNHKWNINDTIFFIIHIVLIGIKGMM